MRSRPLSALPPSLWLLLAIAAMPAQADPRPTPGVTCTAGGLRAPPQFTQISPGRAEYNFSGVCTTREGESLGYRIDGTWTPDATGGNANASEVYRVDRLSGPSESFTALVGWRCDADPWLHDTQCVRIGDNLPHEPYAFWEEFGRGSMPSSHRALSAQQRAALLADYERANGRRTPATMPDRITLERPLRALSPAGVAPGPVSRQPSDEAALNPQPLPPDPDPDPDPLRSATTPVASGHAETSIIIVGGKPIATPILKPRVLKDPGGP